MKTAYIYISDKNCAFWLSVYQVVKAKTKQEIENYFSKEFKNIDGVSLSFVKNQLFTFESFEEINL